MDIWGLGCVMFEIISLYPLFPGGNELDQIDKIHNILGTPSRTLLRRYQTQATHIEFNFAPKVGEGFASLIPNTSGVCIDLLGRLLTYDPVRRISAKEALKHKYFENSLRKYAIEQGRQHLVAATKMEPLKASKLDKQQRRSKVKDSEVLEIVSKESDTSTIRERYSKQRDLEQSVKLPKLSHLPMSTKIRKSKEQRKMCTLPALQGKQCIVSKKPNKVRGRHKKRQRCYQAYNVTVR